MDEVAIYMAFEGMFGTCGVCGGLGTLAVVSDLKEDVLWCVEVWAVSLLTPSGTALGRGGGNGDIEMLDMEAECAW